MNIYEMLEKTMEAASCVKIDLFNDTIGSIEIHKQQPEQSPEQQSLQRGFTQLKRDADAWGVNIGDITFIANAAFLSQDGSGSHKGAIEFPFNHDGLNQFASYLGDQILQKNNADQSTASEQPHEHKCKHECGHTCSDCHATDCQQAPNVALMIWDELNDDQRHTIFSQLNNSDRETLAKYLNEHKAEQPTDTEAESESESESEPEPESESES